MVAIVPVGTLGLLSPFGWLLFGFIVLAGAWQASAWIVSACQWLFHRFCSPKPGVSPTCSSPGEGSHDSPPAIGHTTSLPRAGDLHSSPLPASSSADLESAVFLAPVSLAAIDPAPDFDAFGAGVELVVFTVLFTIGSFLVLNWIIRTMRSSK